jgi:peptide/nickel transport system ATP-binding protein
LSEGRASDVLLEAKNLSVTFKKMRGTLRRTETIIHAVDDVSFKINRSDVVALVGESGSGKTTLAKCLLGLIRPNSGSIVLDGMEVANMKDRKALLEYRRAVQIIYQDPFESLAPRHDVHTTLSIPLRQLLGMNDKKEITERIHKLLEDVGLEPSEIIHRYPHQLSGGQRQRVNIARALAPGPKLLVADEPVTMLDAAQKLKFLFLLLQLQEKLNLTVLLITHDLASAKLLSRKTMIMYLGKIVEQGDTRVVLSNPRHPYVELILSSTPNLSRTVITDTQKLTWIEDSEKVSKGCVFQPRCKYSSQQCVQEVPQLTEKPKSHYAACFNPLNNE